MYTISSRHGIKVYMLILVVLQLVDFNSWKVGGSENTQMDVKGNTFVFGLILLEIISGRPPFCKDTGYLIDWVINTTNSQFN